MWNNKALCSVSVNFLFHFYCSSVDRAVREHFVERRVGDDFVGGFSENFRQILFQRRNDFRHEVIGVFADESVADSAECWVSVEETLQVDAALSRLDFKENFLEIHVRLAVLLVCLSAKLDASSVVLCE